jgi:AcrR family transcriptional regulator
MGIKERRERQKEVLREEILDAARELFAKEGYESVSMRKVAEKIEYSPTTIYLYFKDKSDLLYSVCEETFEKLLHSFEEIAKHSQDPLECLELGLRNYIRFGLTHPNHYKVAFMYRPEDLSLEDISRFISPDSTGTKAYYHLRDIVAECVRQKKFKEIDPEMVAQSLWASCHGIVSLLIVKCHFPWVDKEKLIDHTINTIFASLKI